MYQGDKKCLFFRKIWRALFSCYLYIEILIFLPNYRRTNQFHFTDLWSLSALPESAFRGYRKSPVTLNSLRDLRLTYPVAWQLYLNINFKKKFFSKLFNQHFVFFVSNIEKETFCISVKDIITSSIVVTWQSNSQLRSN